MSVRCLGMLLAVLALALIDPVDARAQIDEEAARQLYASIESPRTPQDLLENIKAAFYSGALLRRDFYTDDNLKRFMGAAAVRLDHNEPSRIDGYVHAFGHLIEPLRVGDRQIDGLTLRFRRVIDATGGVEASLSLTMSKSSRDRPTFEEVEAIFGKHWTRQEPQLELPHAPHTSTTAPNGNARIAYENVRESIRLWVKFDFSSDAQLQNSFFRLSSARSVRP